MLLIAHSGRVAQGISPQPYGDHVAAVESFAAANAKAALRYRAAPEPAFEIAAKWASAFHDLGKLESENQRLLGKSEGGHLPVNHVDAGVAHLLATRQWEAAISVYGHHKGLCDLPTETRKDEIAKQGDSASAALRDYEIKLATDSNLSSMLDLHRRVVGPDPAATPRFTRKLTGIERRLLISCLVDADHTDTARHYGQESARQVISPRWSERLASLDAYVASLAKEPGPRDRLRRQIYEACRSASPQEPFWTCDSPVGSGKTTAIMAYLLQAAAKLNLRHIFVVLPFMNIVNQSVDVYRKALVLAGEDPKIIVAAHHHQADFQSVDHRYLTTLWESPIIVTTAVQFFETISAHHTARLRKFHQLPGSAVFIDEAHAAMPIHLWPFMWAQLKNFGLDWSCRFVLGSGSLSRFWQNPRIMGEGKTEDVPSMVPEPLRSASFSLERKRVQYFSRPDPLTLKTLCDWIQQQKGSRLVVMNTVQSAALVANELRHRDLSTLHLSTALAPADREVILQRVKANLKYRTLNWALVATSCVEAGVDFSFVTAFRERARATSLIQIGGRVNRHGKDDIATVWDFIVNDPQLTAHPDFKDSRVVVEELFKADMWKEDPATLVTYALEQEFKREGGEDRIAEIFDTERVGAYPCVSKLTRLITADTRLAIVDPYLIHSMRLGLRVDPHEVRSHSVQLWSRKIEKLALTRITGDAELYAWEYEYDPDFLGVMAGILKQQQIESDGYAII
jgi:CRISPR-associated endonuclease/helicase Cas3